MNEIFSPYLSFIIFFVTIIINIYLIVKKVDWIVLIIANLVFNVILSYFHLSPFQFLSNLINGEGGLVDLIGELLSGLWPF